MNKKQLRTHREVMLSEAMNKLITRVIHGREYEGNAEYVRYRYKKFKESRGG